MNKVLEEIEEFNSRIESFVSIVSSLNGSLVSDSEREDILLC